MAKDLLQILTNDAGLTAAEYGVGPVWIDGVEHWSNGSNYVSAINTLEFSLYGPTLDGVTDNAALLSQAMSDAVAKNKVLILPPGELGISNVVVTCPLQGQFSFGTVGRSEIVALATDGSPCLDLQNTGSYSLNDFSIISGAAAIPKVSTKNTIGIRLGTYGGIPVEDYSCSRGVLRNIKIYGLAQGIFAQGWLNSFENIRILNCDLGVHLDYQNHSTVDLVLENNAKDFIFTKCDSMVVNRLECEGAYGDEASTIDSSDDLYIASYRTEQPSRSASWLKIGFSGSCNNLTIASGSTSSCNYNDQIEIDAVNVINLGSAFSTADDKRSFSTTVNTKNLTAKYGNAVVNKVARDSEGQNIALNFFPNPYLANELGGFKSVTVGGGNRAVITKETTIFRTGSSAIRIACVGGFASNYAALAITDSNIIEALKGKEVTLSAWVWVPDQAGYDTSVPNVYAPAIRVGTKLAGDQVDGPTSSAVGYYQHNSWNYLTRSVQLSAGIDEIEIDLFANILATLAVGTEYIVVDSIFMSTGEDAARNIYEGRIIDAPQNYISTNAGRRVFRLTIADTSTANKFIEDARQDYVVGDRVEYIDPIPGGFLGKICTTGGTGAASVWKDFGNIAA